MNITRPTLYNWFELAVIPYDNLEKASDALGIDLFEEIKKEFGGKEIKFYKPIDPPQVQDKNRAVYLSEKVQVSISLDGSADHLEVTIAKLRAMNQALSVFAAE